VEETAEGITLKQNRFLSTSLGSNALMKSWLIRSVGTGDCKAEEDNTLWWIPLEFKTVDDSGKASIDHKVFLTEREIKLPIKNVKNATYKLNAETAGVYRVSYPPERLAKLGEEASSGISITYLPKSIGWVLYKTPQSLQKPDMG